MQTSPSLRSALKRPGCPSNKKKVHFKSIPDGRIKQRSDSDPRRVETIYSNVEDAKVLCGRHYEFACDTTCIITRNRLIIIQNERVNVIRACGVMFNDRNGLFDINGMYYNIEKILSTFQKYTTVYDSKLPYTDRRNLYAEEDELTASFVELIEPHILTENRRWLRGAAVQWWKKDIIDRHNQERMAKKFASWKITTPLIEKFIDDYRSESRDTCRPVMLMKNVERL